MINSETARMIFRERFFGVKEIQDVFGSFESTYELSLIPVDEDFARFLFQEGYDLFFFPEFLNGHTMTPQTVVSVCSKRFPQKVVLYDFHDPHKWYVNDKDCFFYNEKTTPGWKFIKRRTVDGSYFKTYDLQTKILTEEISRLNYAPVKTLSQGRTDATFDIFSMPSIGIAHTSVNQNYRSSFLEELFRLVVMTSLGYNSSLEEEYVWTKTSYLDQELVRIGHFDESGADVTKRDVYDGNSKTGVTAVLSFDLKETKL